jgi:hypothetical protein
MRFSREYEKQADLEGAQIMALAGYDPRDMANMFKTIEEQGGSGGPQWLSDHPNPGNRSEYITEEARSLHVEHPVSDTRAFNQIKSHLESLPAAPTTEEATKNAGSRAPSGGTGTPPTGRVEPPASRYRSYTEGGLFRVSVPSNWRELQSQSSVTFAPEGGYGQTNNGNNVFTHGVEIGVARNETHDLETATDELIRSLAQGNPQMRRTSNTSRASVGGRSGLSTTVSNVSEVTGAPETVAIFTTLMPDGNLLYLIAVAPSSEFSQYQRAFQHVVGSVQLTNQR